MHFNEVEMQFALAVIYTRWCKVISENFAAQSEMKYDGSGRLMLC